MNHTFSANVPPTNPIPNSCTRTHPFIPVFLPLHVLFYLPDIPERLTFSHSSYLPFRVWLIPTNRTSLGKTKDLGAPPPPMRPQRTRTCLPRNKVLNCCSPGPWNKASGVLWFGGSRKATHLWLMVSLLSQPFAQRKRQRWRYRPH